MDHHLHDEGTKSARKKRFRGASSPMEWLSKAEDVLIDDGSPLYRLAVLLIERHCFQMIGTNLGMKL